MTERSLVMPRLYPSLSILGRNSAGDVGLVAQFFGLLELAVDSGRREAGSSTIWRMALLYLLPFLRDFLRAGPHRARQGEG